MHLSLIAVIFITHGCPVAALRLRTSLLPTQLLPSLSGSLDRRIILFNPFSQKPLAQLSSIVSVQQAGTD